MCTETLTAILNLWLMLHTFIVFFLFFHRDSYEYQTFASCVKVRGQYDSNDATKPFVTILQCMYITLCKSGYILAALQCTIFHYCFSAILNEEGVANNSLTVTSGSVPGRLASSPSDDDLVP